MGLRDLKTPAEQGKHFCLIGNPVAHSLSPVMHNAAYQAAGVDWSYKAVECADEDEAKHQIALVRTGVYDGLNVTTPYKRLALELADYADNSAVVAQGANVLLRRGADLWAYNTDGEGAVNALEREGAVLGGARACVCGTGPTARAIALAIGRRDADEVVVFSRDVVRGQAACEHIRGALGRESRTRIVLGSYDEAWKSIPGASIIVDATPLGMQPGDPAPFDTALLHPGQTVMDVVYGHGETALVRGAAEQGATALDGVGMLVEQAVLAIELWKENLGYVFEVDRGRMRGPRTATA